MIANVVMPLTLQLAIVCDVSQWSAARLSSLPMAQMGKPVFFPTLLPVVAKTLPPAFLWQSVAMILAHLPAATAGVSFMAATICTATFLRVDSPYYSTPSIDSSELPYYYVPPNGDVAAPGYPNPGPPTCWPLCQLSFLALDVPPHVYC